MQGEGEAPQLHIEGFGAGTPTLLLLHGMGATAAVWGRVIGALETRWSGRVVVVDLPGHGASAPLDDYSPVAVAAAIGAAVPATGPVIAVGHSFGGYARGTPRGLH